MKQKTKTYWITAHPYANQEGCIEVPAEIQDDEVQDWIENHFENIKFEEAQLDYRGADFEYGRELVG